MLPRPKGKWSLFHSIQTKYAMIYIVVITAVLILLNTYPLLVYQDLVFQSKQRSLQSQTAVIASALAVSESLTADSVELAMDILDDMGLARIMITDPAGLVLYDTLDGAGTLERYALFWEIATALRGYDVFRCDYSEGAFRSHAAAPVVFRGLHIGAVYLYDSDTEQSAYLLGIQSNLRTISLATFALVLALSFFFAKMITRRIGGLLGAMRIVREGEYSHRVRLSGRDELAQLADEFNQLTGRLQTVEEARRRFVSDASHELKTPLASIRLLTDSILQSSDIPADTVHDFVGDIGEEADRLTRISEKLLALTRLDAEHEIERGPVDLADVVRRVTRMIAPLAGETDVTIETRLDEGCVVAAGWDELYQVVYNLVENAVKYNLPGGSVVITLEGREDVLLVVEDTGVGIPSDDLPRIFDRFYRVDKARARAAGGTGLGLSIVWDTVQQHGGSIEVGGREDKGTRFAVHFARCAREQEEPQ